jgi:hypothetical protein
MKKIKKTIVMLALTGVLCVSTGCSMLESEFNNIKGSLVGNSYKINTYDNYGSKVLETSGDKINISGNKIKSKSYNEDGSEITNYDLSSVITITIDGK